MSNDLSVLTESNISTLPEELQKKILQFSKQIQDGAAVSVNRIRFDAKNYIFPDQSESQTFTGIIVAVKHGNVYYPDEYDENNIKPPRCIAVGDANCKDLTPHENVVEPCGEACGTCEKFQWGSANKGRGKACSELTLLAVYIPSLGDDLYVLEEKKGNSRLADAYLLNVTNKYGHPIAVRTQFTIGEKTKWEQSFEAIDKVNTDMLQSLANRFEEGMNLLTSRLVDSYKAESTPVASNAPTVNVRPARN